MLNYICFTVQPALLTRPCVRKRTPPDVHIPCTEDERRKNHVSPEGTGERGSGEGGNKVPKISLLTSVGSRTPGLRSVDVKTNKSLRSRRRNVTRQRPADPDSPKIPVCGRCPPRGFDTLIRSLVMILITIIMMMMIMMTLD